MDSPSPTALQAESAAPDAIVAPSATKHPRPPPHLYLNRELGQLAFTRRVLAQAENRACPLLERLKFLCIVSSNLDEFFEIRVAELKERIKMGDDVARPGEDAPADTYTAVTTQAHIMVAEQYRLLNREILPA